MLETNQSLQAMSIVNKNNDPTDNSNKWKDTTNNVSQKQCPYSYISKQSEAYEIKYTMKSDDNLNPKRSDWIRDNSRSFIEYKDDSSKGNFVNSSIQRWRLLPKTFKKVDYSKIANSKLTTPFPFALSKSNYNKWKVKEGEKPK